MQIKDYLSGVFWWLFTLLMFGYWSWRHDWFWIVALGLTLAAVTTGLVIKRPNVFNIIVNNYTKEGK